MNHQPVLLHTAIDYLQVQPAHWYLDATFGGGGHTREIIARGGRVIAFDYDDQAISVAKEKFASEIASQKLVLVRANFADLTKTLAQLQADQKLPQDFRLLGVLFDFGTNSDQLTSHDRGLSFSATSIDEAGPLDMRLDSRLGVTARDLLLALPEVEIARMLLEYGGEKLAKPIARAIIQVRTEQGLEQALLTNYDLSQLVMQVYEKSYRSHVHSSIHPATKTFQALRIVVNNEIENIELALPQALTALEPTQTHSARLVTIAFHEGEDRPVKKFMQAQAQENPTTISLITKKPLVPSEKELARNPRARSAKLRCLEKHI